MHVADLHLDSQMSGISRQLPSSMERRCKDSSFVSFTRIVDKAIEEKIDFMLIAGDVYDSHYRSMRAQIRFKKEMERLHEIEIRVFIIHGNHDYLMDNTLLDLPCNVYIFGKEVECIPYIRNNKIIAYIHGFSYESRTMQEDKIDSYKIKNTEHFHIGMIHGSIGQDFHITQLKEKNYDYWALGHIHKREIIRDMPPIVYAGNIQGRHRKEIGEKGCIIVYLDKYEVEMEFFRSDDICFRNIEIYVDDMENVTILLEKIEEITQLYQEVGRGVFIRVILKGNCTFVEELYRVDELLDGYRDTRKDFVIVEYMDKTVVENTEIENVFLEEVMGLRNREEIYRGEDVSNILLEEDRLEIIKDSERLLKRLFRSR